MNNLRDQIHQNAVDKGFWDTNHNIGEKLMLVVTELAEALEADRGRGNTLNREEFEAIIAAQPTEENFKSAFETYVKDTFEDEIADTIIRLLDLCGFKGIDIQWHIEQKMMYNSTRQKLHGKKY